MGGIANVENVVCGNTITPQVSITNLGTTALTTGTIAWTLNGGSQQTQAWSGNLAQYASTTVNLPLMYLVNGSNSLEVSFINPNGVTDENPINNTSSLTFTALATPTYNIQLQLILDDMAMRQLGNSHHKGRHCILVDHIRMDLTAQKSL